MTDSSSESPENDGAQECAAHADWKRMFQSAIKAAELAAASADHLRALLDQHVPDWRSLDAAARVETGR